MLYLVKNGVPWDVATRLSPTRRFGMVVALGELAGGSYDWGARRWREKKP